VRSGNSFWKSPDVVTLQKILKLPKADQQAA
jgi:hypothetical protein